MNASQSGVNFIDVLASTDRKHASTPNSEIELRFGWQAGRQNTCSDEKRLMAEDFVRHEFLVKENNDPESKRETVSSIVVNSGTTPSKVVDECLEWLATNWKRTGGPFTVSWCTPGAHVLSAIRKFRTDHPQFRSAAELYLIPGPVDPEVEAVVGNVPAAFMDALRQKTRYSYAILSAFSFDMSSGTAYFQFEREVAPQRACACLSADRKYLFLDHEKFRPQGHAAYGLGDLLESSREVTIYTVDSLNTATVIEQFKELAFELLRETEAAEDETDLRSRTLRLIVVGNSGTPRRLQHTGYLVKRERPS